jgi:hypothetical protein
MMLKLDQDQFMEAVAQMADALAVAEIDQGLRTRTGRAMVMLEALGAVCDVTTVDPGPQLELDEMLDRIRDYNKTLGAK